jgi:site-specific DNA-methyltransferase (adenine-specific)
MSVHSYLDGRVALHAGDCLEVLARLPEASVDSVVTDPPYGLQFMGRKWDKLWRNGTEADKAYVERTDGELTSRARKLPDYSASKPAQMQEFHEAWAREVLRILKPGGHLVAFSGTRTYHRMACAIEDAGFEIRDQIGWTYGSGFPKSLDVSKQISKAEDSGCKREGCFDKAEEWKGWGTALKPAWEPICLARKPLATTVSQNVLEYGTGAINIDGCRIAGEPVPMFATTGGRKLTFDGRPQHVQRDGDSTIGRWPANLIHDGSEDVMAGFPETVQSGFRSNGSTQSGSAFHNNDGVGARGHDDVGSAARFFYTAKADNDDRLGSKHPTVKPVDLMQWLVRLVTPKNGTVLDPFAGTGTTGEAAWREGMRAVLIERESEYLADIARRMELATNPTKRTAVAKTKNKLDDPNDLPLFAQFMEAAQ